MDSLRQVSGRFSDPDVSALVRAHGSGLGAYDIIRAKADELLARFAEFDTDSLSPLDRIKALASVAGFQVQPAGTGMAAKGRAAMFVPSAGGGKGYIVYDSTLPLSRVIFSIGHEITHSFFPNSQAGVQFRSVVAPSSRPGRQLEMLCEFGASLLVMPEPEFRTAVSRCGFGFEHIDAIRTQFGSSFEATTYRMAQTAPFPAAAAKLRYRLAKSEMQAAPSSGFLFPSPAVESVRPKYRCQSFHRSPSFPAVLPFNKSLPDVSCVYRAAPGDVVRAIEAIPVTRKPLRCRVEAVQAPYQPDDADAAHPDVLLLIQLVSVQDWSGQSSG